jgi:hypothetical protein
MSSDNPCPGACNYRWREAQDAYKQALAEYDRAARLDPHQSRPEAPEIRPWPGSPVWCARDSATIRRELTELDYLAAMLAQAADGQRGQRPGAKMPAGKQHGGPSASPAADLLEELAGDLREWESEVRGGEPLTRRGHLDTETSMMIAWLCGAGHFARAMATVRPSLLPDGRTVPWAAKFGDGVHRWHRKLARITKAGSGTHHRGVRCPRCEEMAVWWTEGDDHAVCHGKGNTCGRLIGLDELDGLAAEQDDTRTRALREQSAGAAQPAA